MKGLISSLVFFLPSLLSSNNIEYMPFDWGYQFGYLNNNGMIMWGEDWKSKKLLFDGTWSIFPPMYGKNIEEGFLNDSANEISLDKSNVTSIIKYHQGDYGLDKFSIGIDYFKDNRHLKLFGFKRTYLGNVNQYYINTLQPQQQSYTLSIESFDTDANTGMTIGHFNTLAGFPDTVTNGIFDNRITSLNYFWGKKIGSLFFELIMDQFLQRYKAVHSLSFYDKSRYLNRSIYKAEVTSSINSIPILLGLRKNNRSTVLDSTVNTGWYDIYSTLRWEFINISTDITKYENQFFYNYNIIIDKKFRNVKINILNRTRSLPVHPYYVYNTRDTKNPKFYHEFFHYGYVEWGGLKDKFSLMMSATEVQQRLGQISSSMQNQYSNVKVTYSRNINPSLDISLYSNIMSTENYYSGGIGKDIGMVFQSQFSLFNNFMKIELNSEVKHLFDRVNYSIINPIEMIPMVINKNDQGELTPATLINGDLKIKVSSAIFEFRWINISEIIWSSIQSNKNNFIVLHPNMPTMGRQINFSINWVFQD